MTLSRRTILRAAATAAVAAGSGIASAAGPTRGATPLDWDDLRGLFDLRAGTVHMSTMLIASHPAPVAEAIERHRRALDRDPVEYLEMHGDRLTRAARAAAADRLGVRANRVALTESTTAGVGLVYTGLNLKPGQEILTSEDDYYVTHESLRLLAGRTGASVRRVALPSHTEAEAAAVVERIVDAIRPQTRLLALTWVLSSTGLKIPAAAIAEAVRDINADRDEDDAVLFGLDAVHGFAVEADDLASLGVDYFMAGCHKWLFGPRGTGVVAMSERGLAATRPAVPSFDDSEVFSAWYVGREPRGGNSGPRMSPGGFKAFEHRWALTEAFALHDEIGRERVEARTHALATRLKQGLGTTPGVTVRTPMAPELSAGIVAFDHADVSPRDLCDRLRARRVIASVAPYPRPLVRLTPSVRNDEDDVDRAIEAVRDSL